MFTVFLIVDDSVHWLYDQSENIDILPELFYGLKLLTWIIVEKSFN